MRITKLAVLAALTAAFALTTVASSQAQGSDVTIVRLECVDDPDVAGIQELVEIKNQGDTSQQLAGWQLQSDPPGSEVFDLIVLGGLQSEASVFIQSGPDASGLFKWGNEFIFRDGDPTDYVRIVDDTGAVIDEVSCGTAQPTPTPTPSPTPEPSPVNGVPNGGGPPPVSGGALSSLMMILFGGSMAAAGVAAITLPWMRLRRALRVAPSEPQGTPQDARLPAQPTRRDSGRAWMVSAGFGVALVGLTVVVALLILGRHRD